MRRNSTAPLLAMCLAFSSPSGVYIDIDGPVRQDSGGHAVDVIVGNRGEATDGESFDALLEVRTKAASVCRAVTNFVTPIAPGQRIRALRFQLRPSGTEAIERFTVRASIRYWDESRGVLQRETSLTLPRGQGTCLALKPTQ